MTGRRSERGVTFVMAALLLTVVMLSAAMAVDLGRLAAERRRMQAAADVVSIDLSRWANGRTEAQILADPGYAPAFARSIADNGLGGDAIQVRFGTWDMQTRTFTDTAPDKVPDAVEVRATRSISHFFQPGGNSTTRTAVSHNREIAHLSLGSRFGGATPCIRTTPDPSDTCAVDGSEDADALNDYLSGLHGIDVDFDVLTYEGLVTANVTMGDLAAAAGFGTVDEFAEAEFTPSEMASISAQALANNGDSVRAGYYTAIGELGDDHENEYSESPQQPVRPKDLYEDVDGVDADGSGPGQNRAANVRVNLFDLFVGAVELSNRQSGFTGCTGTTAPEEVSSEETDGVVDPVQLGPVLLVSDKFCSTVVQARKHAIGGVDDAQTSPPEFRTAQFVIGHTSLLDFGRSSYGIPIPVGDPTEEVPELSDVPGIPGGVGVPIPVSGTLEIPIELSGAGAEGTLTEITCSEAENEHLVDVIVNLRPLVLELGRGQTTPIGSLRAAGVTFEVFLDKTVQPAGTAGEYIDDLPVHESDGVNGDDPFLNLFVGPNDVRVKVTGLPVPTTVPTVPNPPPVPPVPPVPPPPAGLPGQVAGPVPPEDPPPVPTSEPLPTTTVVPPPPEDPTEEALREYFATVINKVIREQIGPQLVPVLDLMGFSITTADVTNEGVGFPIYNEDRDVIGIDVQCASPTLVL